MKCTCHKCVKLFNVPVVQYFDNKVIVESGFTGTRMIICEKCGNKRCPHASDHDLECTHSNEPGQPGSIYK